MGGSESWRVGESGIEVYKMSLGRSSAVGRQRDNDVGFRILCYDAEKHVLFSAVLAGGERVAEGAKEVVVIESEIKGAGGERRKVLSRAFRSLGIIAVARLQQMMHIDPVCTRDVDPPADSGGKKGDGGERVAKHCRPLGENVVIGA